MDKLPEGIDLPRHRDFEGRGPGQWLKHGFLLLLFAFVVAGLLGAFGQQTTVSTAEGPGATLKVASPDRLRGGLLYQARIEIHADTPIEEPRLVLDRGWFEQKTVNTFEPEPEESSSDGRHFEYLYPPLDAGRTLLVLIDLQVNPTDIGSHDADVVLYDGTTRLASVDRTQFVFP